MNRWQELYKEKLTTPEELAKKFNSGDVCLSNGQVAEPTKILEALAERAQKENLTGLKHCILLPLRSQKYLKAGMEKHIYHVSHFVSGFDREPIWEGRADYMPSHYSQVPIVWQQTLEAPDVYYCTVSPMDEHGYFSFGTSGDMGNVRRLAKKVFVEVNPTMPRTFGNCFIHITEIDALIENDIPITEVPPAKINEKDIKIGQMIAEEIPNGATIQLGIGGIPNAVAKALMDKKDLGVHSEMFCDSMVDLYNAGVINNSKKTIHRGKFVAAFTFGARQTYDFLDNNPAVEFHPVDYVNDPCVIAQNDNMMSINSCIEIDLFGQACSETMGSKNFSGVGGQMDFVRGAADSKGGKSFIAFQSTTKKDTISKIKPALTHGSCVSTTRNDIDYVATEYGITRLKGLTCSERAKELIRIAHPNFRDELTKAAKEMHII